MAEQLVPCPVCGTPTHPERLEIGLNCVGCTDQRPYIGNTEGVSKQGILNIVRSGTEDARRAFNGGKAIIRRDNPASVRIRKGAKFT